MEYSEEEHERRKKQLLSILNKNSAELIQAAGDWKGTLGVTLDPPGSDKADVVFV